MRVPKASGTFVLAYAASRDGAAPLPHPAEVFLPVKHNLKGITHGHAGLCMACGSSHTLKQSAETIRPAHIPGEHNLAALVWVLSYSPCSNASN